MAALNLKQAADFLNLHPETLRRLASRGIVPCKRIGEGPKPIYRFIQQKLEGWLGQEPPFVDPRRIQYRKEVTL